MMCQINDVREIREIFSGFNIDEVSLTYTASSQGRQKANELVIGNWEEPISL